ncbi:MAG: methyltransferase domain-containing protein [Rickettsiaceae bacterium]|nr:methyltransferase domain-containing protein [Rickettsiaceae bacterium]
MKQLFNRNILKSGRDFAADKLESAFYEKLFLESAEILAETLAFIPPNIENILEMGARVGTFTKILLSHYPRSSLQVTDMSENMLFYNKASNKLCCDEETYMHFPLDEYNLIASNLNLHWINNLPEFLFKIRHMLTKKGIFIASLFGENSLFKTQKLLIEEESKLTSSCNIRISPFIKANSLAQLLLDIGFKNVVVDLNHFDIPTCKLLNFSNYLRNIGESNIMQTRYTPISRNLYEKLCTMTIENDQYTILNVIAKV